MDKKLSDLSEVVAGPVKDAKGRFVKGHSGNPGGASKEKVEIINLCKSMSEDVINVLYTITMDTNCHPTSRILAGNSILDRGFGKPLQRKEEKHDENYIPPQMIINMSHDDYQEYLKEQENAIQ